MKLVQNEISDIIERLQNGIDLPNDYKYKLFPVMQKEYELVYGGKMRREDVLANEDGVIPVPLQIEKTYNGTREQWKDGWRNIIVFGDNLQLLKTIYENKDQLIKDKVKGKVKLIFIDPPFGTGDEYDGNQGQKGYSAKTKGAEFVEFLRRRLIVAKEILSPEGSIIVRLDYHFGHYVKVLMDEVFNKENFKNEIIVNRVNKKGFASREGIKAAKYPVATDVLFFYTNSNSAYFNLVKLPISGGKEKWHSMEAIEVNPSVLKPRIILGEERLAPKGTKWKFSQATIDRMEAESCIKLNSKGRPIYKVKNQDFKLLDSNWSDIPGYAFTTGYPTENSEVLLERVIKTTTKEGDIVFDFFGGSGTTAAVAEKLNRKWITCDIGKLASYTIQKRMLNIQNSKLPDNHKKIYKKTAKSFITVNTGHYDLEKIFKLQQDEYTNFVMNLFEVEPKERTISGIRIDGERKDGYNVIIWEYWKFKDASVDEDYLNDLHGYIGNKAGNRVYIIAPASYVSFISDYYEIDNVRYYFLKVPYQVIRELHKVKFKKFRQPQSKNNINDLDDAVGFHFIRQPEVKSEIILNNKGLEIAINKFNSYITEDETGKEMENFESLSMILLDKDFNGNEFDLDASFFAEDFIEKKKKKSIEDEKIVEEELSHLSKIKLPIIPVSECGNRIMLIYIDIFGNEFKEEFKVR